MGFSDAIKTCMGKYATFNGRASRSEYWWFYLFTLLLTWGGSLVAAVTMPVELADLMSVIIGLVFIVPVFAAGSRRLHDIGKSGWWQLLFLTIIGAILLIYWYAKEGDKQANNFGDAPVQTKELTSLA
jgi:uncharacterized membrane protein YhaH (DUF805 family)